MRRLVQIGSVRTVDAAFAAMGRLHHRRGCCQGGKVTWEKIILMIDILDSLNRKTILF